MTIYPTKEQLYIVAKINPNNLIRLANFLNININYKTSIEIADMIYDNVNQKQIFNYSNNSLLYTI